MERRGESMAETPAFGLMNSGLLAMDNPHIADEKGALVQEAGLITKNHKYPRSAGFRSEDFVNPHAHKEIQNNLKTHSKTFFHIFKHFMPLKHIFFKSLFHFISFF